MSTRKYEYIYGIPFPNLSKQFSVKYVKGNMKCLNIHLIHCQVCDQPPTAEVTKTSSAEASGCGEMKRVRRNVKNLTKEERERLVGAMQALIDRNWATST